MHFRTLAAGPYVSKAVARGAEVHDHLNEPSVPPELAWHVSEVRRSLEVIRATSRESLETLRAELARMTSGSST